MQYSNLAGIIGTGMFSLYFGKAFLLETVLEWSFVINIIVYVTSGYIFGILNMQAFMLRPTSDVLPIFYLASFFNFLIDIFIFNVKFHIISLIGGLMILLFCYLLVKLGNK